MATWRELGEVPDSEGDDSYDSDNTNDPRPSLAKIESGTLPVPSILERMPDDAIRDAPREMTGEESLEDEVSLISPPSEEPQPVPDDGRQPSSVPDAHAEPGTQNIDGPLAPQPTESSRHLGTLKLAIPRPWPDNIDHPAWPPLTNVSASPSSPSQENAEAPVEDLAGNAGSYASISARELGDVDLPGDQDDTAAQEDQQQGQTAVRAQRSLRPRKPIQQYPYLLENAQYSRLVRSHGMKPVRIQEPEAPVQRVPQEEDSQNTTTTGPDTTDESQQAYVGNRHDTNKSDGGNAMASSSQQAIAPLGSPMSDIHTDDTTIAGDELPSLDDLISAPQSSKAFKRKSTMLHTSSASKKMKTSLHNDPIGANHQSPIRTPTFRTPLDVFELDSSPISIARQGAPRGPAQRISPRPDPNDDPTHIQSDSDKLEDDGSDIETDSSSDSGTEIVQAVKKRIRGVLPASWLRLDLQQAAQKNRAGPSSTTQPRRRAPSLLKSPKAISGHTIYQPGAGVPRPLRPMRLPSDLFSDSDDEDTPSTPQAALPSTAQSPIFIDGDQDDDSGSEGALEINHIDHMASRKRQSTGVGVSRPRKQAKITFMLGQHKPTTSTLHSASPKGFVYEQKLKATPRPRLRSDQSLTKKHTKSGRGTKGRRGSKLKVPRLSILDVIEPDAPRFLKIAARTAKRKDGKGRSSTSKFKSIILADSRDTADVMDTVISWKQGRIRPRPSVVPHKRSAKNPRQTLAPLSRNQRPAQPPILRAQCANSKPISDRGTAVDSIGQGRKVVRINRANVDDMDTEVLGLNSFEIAKKRIPTRIARGVTRRMSSCGKMWSVASAVRPAQLESDITERTGLHEAKKMLDSMFKHAGSRSGSSGLKLNSSLARQSSHLFVDQMPHHTERKPISLPQRRRKQAKPCHIDTGAPQYILAHEPASKSMVPLTPEPPVVIATENGTNSNKLLGLGPYGAQYSHHFDAFPLDSRIYFHESTMLGSGILCRISHKEYIGRLRDERPSVRFSIDGKALHWASWDDRVSSEFGILLDWAAEHIAAATDAIKFMLDYVLGSLNFAGGVDESAFVPRIVETFRGFALCMDSLVTQSISNMELEQVASTCANSAMLVLAAFHICQASSAQVGYSISFEDLIRDLTRTCVKALSINGLGGIRRTYDDLRGVVVREQGLRDAHTAIHSWVVIIRVLEMARIPRMGFWDIASPLIRKIDVSYCLDAGRYEEIWEDFFTLLPLTEFDDSGFIRQGSRHVVPVEGWAIPQQLVRRIFDIYQAETRQAPSFNDYCRALIGRCHFLVQQWGWRKCTGIVGVIFDFFGSQNLAHLRNEEASRSPAFLESLGESTGMGTGLLLVEPRDACFNIFLKLLATLIHKLRRLGAINDIRNIIARTMPNHNRQHLKEQAIHERDLAALRNHHDLLCTLFWAAPPELRPSPRVIEKLVVPANSHKEACLINLRSWNQLARFLVASDASPAQLRPFALWQVSVFQQIVAQFDSAAADIQQQFRALAKDVSARIDGGMLKAMIKANKAAALDVLHFSIMASLDLVRHATLRTAQFAVNIWQLKQVFQRFRANEFDWTLLRPALDTLDYFLEILHRHAPEFTGNIDPIEVEDAILILDREVSGPFFAMVRSILSLPKVRIAQPEKCFHLAARLALRLSQAGVIQLPQMFSHDRSKYSIFTVKPSETTPNERACLAIFVFALLERGQAGAELGVPLLELWVLSLVKPRKYLSYEYKLGSCLREHRQCLFVPESIHGVRSIRPDYLSNRQLFEYAVSHMRSSLRDVDAGRRKRLVSEYSSVLRSVMSVIKADLKAECEDVLEHGPYVTFVREIISLIKSHANEICAIDEFFFQINQEYSPSAHDPRLHVAGMISYGIRLGERDARVSSQLWYYMFNNFKTALANNKLAEEVGMVRKGMETPSILAFILGRMLPSIVQATFRNQTAHPFLDVYGESLRLLLTEHVVPHEIPAEDAVHVATIYQIILKCLEENAGGGGHITQGQAHILQRAVSILNCFWPSLAVIPWMKQPPDCASDLWSAIASFSSVAEAAEAYLVMHIRQKRCTEIDVTEMLRGLDPFGLTPPPAADGSIQVFADNIIADVQKNWILTTDRIVIRAPGRGGGTAYRASTGDGQGNGVCPGTQRKRQSLDEAVEGLYEQLKEWSRCWARINARPRPGMSQLSEEALIF